MDSDADNTGHRTNVETFDQTTVDNRNYTCVLVYLERLRLFYLLEVSEMISTSNDTVRTSSCQRSYGANRFLLQNEAGGNSADDSSSKASGAWSTEDTERLVEMGDQVQISLDKH